MGCAAWVLSELKAEESFLTVSTFVLPFFLALAALTFFFSSSSAHWQGIHLRKLHLSAAPTRAGLAAGDASLSVWLAVRHLYHLKDFPPISFFAFLLILFFSLFFPLFFFLSSWETTANTSHLAVIAVRWTGDYRQKAGKMIRGREERSRGEPVQCLLESSLFSSTQASLKEQKATVSPAFPFCARQDFFESKIKVSLLISWVKIKRVPYLSQQKF